MNTLRLSVDADHLDSAASRDAIDRAASILRSGGLVAFPTETVYGLGANALDPQAVERVFLAKQRPNWDPLIVHISNKAMLSVVISEEALPEAAVRLMEAFWPGPLTLLLPKANEVPASVTAGRPLVGVRIPTHPVARALIAAAGVPVAAPSANTFGRISPTLAAHVLEDLDGRIDAILDSGETTHGLESTVVDASTDPVIVYRPGVITLDQIREICGSAVEWIPKTQFSAQPHESLPSPGVGIRHYAPHARLVLISAGIHQSSRFAETVQSAARDHARIGIMLPASFVSQPLPDLGETAVIYNWGEWNHPAILAHRMFAGLRELDAAGVDVILCPMPPTEGIGAAIQDRLLKAAKQ